MTEEWSETLEEACTRRVEALMERRMQAMEESILSRIQLSEHSSRQQETGGSSGGEAELDDVENSRKRKRKKQQTHKVQPNTAVPMEQFQEDIMQRLQDFEARLDIVELRAAALEEWQAKATSDLSFAKNEGEKQHHAVLDQLAIFSSRFIRVNQDFTEMQGPVKELKRGMKTILSLQALLQKLQTKVTAMNKTQQEQAKLIKAISLTKAQQKKVREKVKQTTEDTIPGPTDMATDMEMVASLTDLESSVEKHQNALIQMRDYLTQHQDFIDSLCKSLGIDFSGAEGDENTPKLPIKFVLEVAEAQDQIENGLKAAYAEFGRIKADLTWNNDTVSTVKSEMQKHIESVAEDRKLLAKVVDAVNMPGVEAAAAEEEQQGVAPASAPTPTPTLTPAPADETSEPSTNEQKRRRQSSKQ